MTISLFSKVTSADQQANFSVSPILSGNQVNSEVGYFDLNLEPGQSEPLALSLRNMSDENINLLVSVHTAFTNVNGVVEYGNDAEVQNSTLPFSLSDYIEGDGKVSLSKGETKQVDLLLTMPKDIPFDGVLAAGIRVEEVIESDISSERQMAIENTLSYVMGVVVSNSRDKVIDPKLELLDVYPDQLNFRNVFSAHIENQTGIFVNQLEVSASVYNENQTEKLFSADKQGMQMAPHSDFSFPIPLNGKSFIPGNYVLHLKATSGELEWEWTKNFVIDNTTSNALNRQDVTIPNQNNYWILVAFVLAMLLVITIVFHKKRKKE